jgi:uncharacterized membrane protein
MPEHFFTEAQKKAITDSIAAAEEMTSGEIRVHLEARCGEDVLDHAAFIFEQLGMHKTELRNGVLFYISFEDHKLAIIGDVGINRSVPADFWESIRNHMVAEFKNGNYATGLSEAIRMAGAQLAQHFPKGESNPNELSNDISYGNNAPTR